VANVIEQVAARNKAVALVTACTSRADMGLPNHQSYLGAIADSIIHVRHRSTGEDFRRALHAAEVVKARRGNTGSFAWMV
jgi:KaiC/GvpD/RAD55 family RecA-like ATPase